MTSRNLQCEGTDSCQAEGLTAIAVLSERAQDRGDNLRRPFSAEESVEKYSYEALHLDMIVQPGRGCADPETHRTPHSSTMTTPIVEPPRLQRALAPIRT